MTTKWPTVQLDTCVKHVKRAILLDDEKTYRRVTVRLRGQGIALRDEVPGSVIKTKKQYTVAANDLLVAEIDAKAGAYGVVPPELAGTIVSGHYFTYEVDQKQVMPAFLDYWLKTPAALDQVLTFIRGALNYAAIRPHQFLQLKLPLPTLDEQEKVVTKIESVVSRVKETQRLRESIEREREEMVRALARELARDAPRRPLQEVAPLVRRPVQIEKDAQYPELGVRSFGKGTFHKPAIAGSELGTKRLFGIEPGDLLFSNVFSWDGAIAVPSEGDRGRFGSHRYITCVPKPDLATAEFLRSWLLTDEGMVHVLEASPGAAGRNRTLGLKKLLAIPIPVPSLDAQRRLSRLSAAATAARESQDGVARDLDDLVPALLDEAFRGPPPTGKEKGAS